MIQNKDVMKVLFNDDSRKLLYSLVDRSNPEGRASSNDDVFEPTVSSIFQLFSELMEGNTPDLYASEWELVHLALKDNKLFV